MTAYAVGDILTATNLNLLLSPPTTRVRSVAVQSIPNNTYTVLTHDTEDVDSHSYHSLVSNTGRITPTVSGWYVVDANCIFAANVTGLRAILLQMNGSSLSRYYKVNVAGGPTSLGTSGKLYFNGSTDYVEAMVYQASGGALNTNPTEDGTPGSNPSLSVVRCREAQT